MNENKTNINWYPGHMAKTKRLIKEQIDLVDVVLLVVDSRVPKSSFIVDIEDFTKGKEKIIVMSKYDLCDKDKTSKWKEYYTNLGYKVVYSSGNQSDKDNIINEIDKCMVSINDKRKEKGLLPKKARVMVVGVSNVGKSTLINLLANRKATVTGNKPGVTTNISTIKINDRIELLDTPGILWPKFESEEVALNLASMSIIKEEVLPLDKVAVYILNKLNDDYKDILKKEFNVEEFDLEYIEEVYETISKFKNIPKLNGEVDYDRVSILIVNMVKNETIKNITFDDIK